MFFSIILSQSMTSLSNFLKEHTTLGLFGMQKNKFDKYYGNVTALKPLLFMAIGLDPRFKLNF